MRCLVQNPELVYPITAEQFPDLQHVSKLRWTDGSVSKQRQVDGVPMFLGRDARNRVMIDLINNMLRACAQPGVRTCSSTLYRSVHPSEPVMHVDYTSDQTGGIRGRCIPKFIVPRKIS